MTKWRIGKKAHTFRGAAALIIAAFFTLAAMAFTACKQPTATSKYKVTFSVDGTGGTLKATADGVAETETSPITVEHGKTVTFTAVPTAGYKVKEWKLGGNAVNGTNPSYTLTVTTAVNVTVNFEPKKALLTLAAGKNTVKVKAKTADGSAIKVEGCSVNELANEAETTLTVTNPERKLALIGDIIELNCSGDENVGGNRPLAELDVSGLTKLQKLNCRGNELTALDVSGLTALQELDCNKNDQLATLNVQGCTALQKLNCQYNQLTALDTSGLTELQELYCNSNQIPELNVQGLTKLQKLNCTGNRLTALDVSGLTALQELYCSANKLTALNVQGCTALKVLDCYKNKLNADAFIEIFNDLPTREVSDGAKAVLYNTESEGNCKNFTTPENLKKAFDNAKDIKHWKMQKVNYIGLPSDI